jgi:hypothetical protein
MEKAEAVARRVAKTAIFILIIYLLMYKKLAIESEGVDVGRRLSVSDKRATLRSIDSLIRRQKIRSLRSKKLVSRWVLVRELFRETRKRELGMREYLHLGANLLIFLLRSTVSCHLQAVFLNREIPSRIKTRTRASRWYPKYPSASTWRDSFSPKEEEEREMGRHT